MYDLTIIVYLLTGKDMSFGDTLGPHSSIQVCMDRGAEIVEKFTSAYPYINSVKGVAIDCFMNGQGA